MAVCELRGYLGASKVAVVSLPASSLNGAPSLPTSSFRVEEDDARGVVVVGESDHRARLQICIENDQAWHRLVGR